MYYLRGEHARQAGESVKFFIRRHCQGIPKDWNTKGTNRWDIDIRFQEAPYNEYGPVAFPIDGLQEIAKLLFQTTSYHCSD
jgi:hypothetical protein